MPGFTDALARFTGPLFVFLDPGALVDGDLRLKLRETSPAIGGRVPTYRFDMVHAETGQKMGGIDLRVGDTADVLTFAGHIGYRVQAAFRGQHYAVRASRLLYALARRHGMREIWITCDPDNMASRRTCELLGGELVSTVAVPKSHAYYKSGSRAKCRFRVGL